MSIGFDIDKIKNYLDNYIKDKSPTKYPVLKISDSSGSNNNDLFVF